jgi:dihydrofolate reductase
MASLAKLIYSMLASVDGYVADRNGSFTWAEPDEEVHAFANDLQRPIGTMLLGRRMYDVLVAWEMMDEQNPVLRDYAELWRGAQKVVFSRSLENVSSARTLIEPDFDADAIRELKATADRDLSIGGPELAGQALAAGLVDEVHLFAFPVVVGGGTRALAVDHLVPLVLFDERRFESGVVYLRYRVAG